MEEEKKMIYSVMADVMGKVSAISKNKKNTQQGFKFRGIDDVMNSLHDIFAECGLVVIPAIEKESREERKTAKGGTLYCCTLWMKYTFYAKDGSFIEASVIGEAMDSGDKATNKAMSIAYKYCMLQTFCIPTEDADDPDASTPPETTSSMASSALDDLSGPAPIKAEEKVTVGNPPEVVEKLAKATGGEIIKEEKFAKKETGNFDLF